MPELGLEWVEAWVLSGLVCFCFTVQSVKAWALNRSKACANSLSYYSDTQTFMQSYKVEMNLEKYKCPRDAKFPQVRDDFLFFLVP